MTRHDSKSTYLQDGKPQKNFQKSLGLQCCTKRKMSKPQKLKEGGEKGKEKKKEKKKKGESYILTMKGRRIKRRVFIPS